MKKLHRVCVALVFLLASVAFVQAAEKEDLELSNDITKETIVGPGSINVITGKDVLMSFGALVRIIPTSESNYDFGMSDNDPAFVMGQLSKNFFKDHKMEAGWVNNNYIRNETKIFFNAMPKDRKWSFYAALECDSVFETSAVDARAGKNDTTSNFGLERLHGTFKFPYNLRLHAGWDVWELDAMEGAGLVYGDDNPGFWLTGDYDNLSFNVGFFKLEENDFQTDVATLNDQNDDDRDLYAGILKYKMNDQNKLSVFYTYDRIRSINAKDLLGALAAASGYAGLFGIYNAADSKTDTHHFGALYNGNFGNLQIMSEFVYEFGKADDTGLAQDDFDINAFAFAADVAFEFKGKITGSYLKPHLGFMYTSGDDDPNDDELSGYTGNTSCQRFSPSWGGENTIIGDTNLTLGTLLYGYIPELYGNGTPVFTGGLENGAGLGNGRGDNPGLSMVSAGVTIAPRRFLIFKINANVFNWNEDFMAPQLAGSLGYAEVKAGYVGTEIDNELTLATTPNSFLRAHASWFIPGEAVEDVTEVLSGEKCDEVATRLAMELIWKF